MRHIFIGARQRVYCGADISRLGTRDHDPPITEGEYLDSVVPIDEVCEECQAAIEPVRGRPIGASDA